MRGSTLRYVVAIAGLVAGAALFTNVSYAQTGTSNSVDAPAYITLLRGDTYQMVVGRSPLSLRIPVDFADGVKPEDLLSKVLDVSLGDRHEELLATAFDSNFDFPTGGHQPALVITMNPALPLEQGTYRLLVDIRPRTPITITPQRVDLSIVLLAAQLRPPQTLVARRVLNWPWDGTNVSVEKAPLILEETGRRSFILGPVIRHIHSTAADGTTVSGQLVPTALPTMIPAGQQAAVDYGLAGSFPYGKVTEDMEITSPQLASPVPVRLEVITQLNPLWILVIMFVGLLFGLLLRTVLRNRIELDNARAAAIQVLEQLDAARVRYPDADLHRGLDGIRASLAGQIENREAANITTAAGDAAGQLTEALKAFTQRQNDLHKSLDALRNPLLKGRSLPPPVAEAVAAAVTDLDAAETHLVASNVTEAQRELGQIQRDLENKLADLADAFKHDLSLALDTVGPEFTKFPFRKPLADKCMAAQAAVEAIPARGSDTGAATWLDSLHDARTKATAFIDSLETILQGTYQATDRFLTPVKPILPMPQLLQALELSVADLVQKLRSLRNQPEAVLPGLAQALADLGHRWREALTQQAAFPNEEAGRKAENDRQRQAIDQSLATGEYIQAATQVAQLVQDNAPRKSTRLEALGESAATPRTATPATVVTIIDMPLAAGPEEQNLRAPTRVIRVGEALPALSVLRASTFRDLFWANFWQHLIAGIIIVAAGYVLFADKFVGTTNDVMTVFFWAFALDVSVDAIAPLAGRFTGN